MDTKVVFEGLDGFLRSVASVVMRRYKLVRHHVELDLLLELVGTFVVKNMLLGEDAGCI